MSDENGGAPVERPDSGFELDGHFYRLRMRRDPKTLLLVDRISSGRTLEIFGIFEGDEETDSDRLGVTGMIALIGASILAEHPSWTVERVFDRLMRIEDIETDIVWIGGETAESPIPPSPGGETSEDPTSTSSAAASSSSSIPTESSESTTSFGIPV